MTQAAIDASAPASAPPAVPFAAAGRTAYPVLLALSFCHLLNDMNQSLIQALYPALKDGMGLSFAQIGLVTLTYQITASLLQPAVGYYTDKRPLPYSLSFGMGATLLGLLLLSVAGTYPMLLAAAALIGVGSSIFHPESSRIARAASGGQHGLAQSLFQLGGNFGSALGPLLAAFVVLSRGQPSVAWFSLAALMGVLLLWKVGGWYQRNAPARPVRGGSSAALSPVSPRTAGIAVAILLLLTFSKNVYMAGLSSYYTFFLIEKFGLSVRDAQLYLFLFLGAVAVGTIAGGPIGDRMGRKFVIWFSILGVLPFTLLLPHVGLFWTAVLSVVIGLILASAFSAILVFAQELMPGRVGTVAGLFFGFAFGAGGLGAAALGQLADHAGIEFVYRLCSFLPAIGILTIFLPSLPAERRLNQEKPA